MKLAAIAAVAAAAALLAPVSARAGIDENVWAHAIRAGTPDPHQDVYEAELRSGDDLTAQATAAGAARETIRALVQHAATAYRDASRAKPDEPEPYYRLGRLLYSFYFECSVRGNRSPLCFPDPSYFDRAHAEEIIAAWDTFEQLAPLDPRLDAPVPSPLGIDFDLLFERAVLHTRMADRPGLEAAARDYEKVLARSDLNDDKEVLLGNLAETYMMLDRLDESIEAYRQAVRSGARSETAYGLAVALDRDERGEQAQAVILAQGAPAVAEFERRVREGESFFVPAGEEYYYFALIYESFGLEESAIEYWQRYIQSGAHPEFQPRAKQHLDTLFANRKKHLKDSKVEAPWRDALP